MNGARAVVTVLMLGCGLVAVTAPEVGAATRPTGPLSLPSGAYFGALVNPDRSTPSSTPAEVSALETRIGRKLDIVNHYYAYDLALGTQGEATEIAGGRIPMVTWGATDTYAIKNGSQDAYLRSQATRLKNLGGSILFRYYHEPEGDYRQSIVHTAADYIAAWRRARSIFDSAGATNVIWMFTTTTYSFRVVPATPPWAYYPGDAYVDWIAGDGYNFAPVKPGAKWNGFATVFGKWYAWASGRPKPMMVAEYGALEDPAIPGRKAAWYDDMRTQVKTNFPLIQGVVAWSTTNTKNGLVYNWNVTSSGSAINSWTAWGADPYYTR
jgi:hypothetical protein